MQIITENYDLGKVNDDFFIAPNEEQNKTTYIRFTIDELYTLLEHIEYAIELHINEIQEISEERKQEIFEYMCEYMYSHISVMQYIATEQRKAVKNRHLKS